MSNNLAARLRRVAGRAARREPLRGAPRAQASPQPRFPGVVEHFSQRSVRGWLSVPAGTGPLKVELYLNDLCVLSTYATPVTRQDDRPRPGKAAAKLGPRDYIPGPGGSVRNSGVEVRAFAFGVRGLWKYVGRRTHLTVRVNGHRLPIVGHGMFLMPPRRGTESVQSLRDLLAGRHVVSQFGDVQLSKKHDVEWQRTVMNLYGKVRDILVAEHGLDVFFMYGTLLGAVREGGYIGHDVDFDAAYVSGLSDPKAVADEFTRVALTLVERGLEVEAHLTALHIRDPEDPSAKVDLFHTYFDVDGVLKLPFGIAGTSTVRRSDWTGTKVVDFPGGRGLVPANAEQVVELLYGSDWRQPKPGFDWDLDRTERAMEAALSTEQRTKIYWADFYSRTEYTSGSSFCDYVTAQPEMAGRAIDLGCGDGRDACALGASGRVVLGLDQSPVGVENARKHADGMSLADRVSFDVCDVSNRDELAGLLSDFVTRSDEPVVFYLRFFLHAISEDVQETVMSVISDVARPGDWFAAEFRTDKDAQGKKVHTKHYRRFQSAAAFREELVAKHGWDVVEDQEARGLSPYRDEDPVLYRVLARH